MDAWQIRTYRWTQFRQHIATHARMLFIKYLAARSCKGALVWFKIIESSLANVSFSQMSQQSLAICDSTTRDTCSSYVSSPMTKRKCRSATRMSALYQEERSPSLLSACCWPSGTRLAARSVASMSTMCSWTRSTGKSQQIW